MRYTVGVSRHRRGYWEVRREGILLGEGNEAEANIIAFALNAVASGHGLYAGTDAQHITEDYTGPTEGVYIANPT